MVKTRENRIGKKYGKLKIIEQVEDYINPKGNHYAKYKCECECGKIIIRQYSNILNKKQQSCGCDKKGYVYKGYKKRKNNIYDLTNEYGIGYTDKGQIFYFDKEDYEKIKKYYWSYDNDGYVSCSVEKNRKKKRILLHRLVMGEIPKGMVIDHLIHDHGKTYKYDNRKSNLQIKTISQNNMNVEKYKTTSSNHIGVQYDKRQKKWQARIGINKKRIHLGWFKTEEEAIKARIEAEKKYYKEYSYENIRKEKENGT